MKSLKKLSLLLLAVICIVSMVSCGNTTPANEVTVTVNARDINGEPLVLGEVTFTDDTPTVVEALQAMCLAREVSCEVGDLGIVNKIGSVGNSTRTDKESGKNYSISWTWKLNGVDSADLKSFANETAVKTGDTIEYYQYEAEAELDKWFEQAGEFEEEDNG